MEGAPQLPTLFPVHTIWKATAGRARGLEVPGVPAGRPTPVAGGGRRGEPCAGGLESKDPTQDPLESVSTSASLEAIAVPPPYPAGQVRWSTACDDSQLPIPLSTDLRWAAVGDV